MHSKKIVIIMILMTTPFSTIIKPSEPITSIELQNLSLQARYKKHTALLQIKESWKILNHATLENEQEAERLLANSGTKQEIKALAKKQKELLAQFLKLEKQLNNITKRSYYE